MPYILMSIILFLADQISKKQANKKIPLGKRIALFDRRLYLTNVRNTGAVMGLFSKNRRCLMGMTFLSLAVWGEILIQAVTRDQDSRLLKTAVAMMSAGAAGNLTNRVKDRYVTDFIHFNHRYAPVFNLADLFILIGSVMYMTKGLMIKKQNMQ